MQHLQTRILTNRPISPDFMEMHFAWGVDAPRPGQFFTVRASESSVPLLRRPFAYSGYDADKGEASMIFQRRGPATEILAAKQPGDVLDTIGPLGKGFDDPRQDGPAILVAGGIGLGPMLFLGRHLQRRGGAVIFVFGCRSRTQIPGNDVFSGISPVICTDDGSTGFAGTSVDYLKTLDKNGFSGVFACGPNAMLKASHAWAQDRGLPCQVSMEQTMACGVGACMGCVVRVKTPPGYARACSEGPVFEGKEIDWGL